MEQIFNLLCELSKSHGISGKESNLFSFEKKLETDEIGNRYFFIQGSNPNAKTIMIEAHFDEIGLCISEILENGFLSIRPCGGLDPNIIPGTKWIVEGKKSISAIASSVPPHLAKLSEKSKKMGFENLYLDAGFQNRKEAERIVSIGDVAYFSETPKKMLGDRFCGRSFDNKVSVVAALIALNCISNPINNVLFLFSVGEETSSRGVRYACKKWNPDFAIVVDAGFAECDGVDSTRCIKMSKGPSVSMTDTLSLSASEWVKKIAFDANLPLQIIAEPGGTGTSATAIQTESNGIPSAVISIPVLNMHTQSEIVSATDIQMTADLISSICRQELLPRKEVILLG